MFKKHTKQQRSLLQFSRFFLRLYFGGSNLAQMKKFKSKPLPMGLYRTGAPLQQPSRSTVILKDLEGQSSTRQEN